MPAKTNSGKASGRMRSAALLLALFCGSGPNVATAQPQPALFADGTPAATPVASAPTMASVLSPTQLAEAAIAPAAVISTSTPTPTSTSTATATLTVPKVPAMRPWYNKAWCPPVDGLDDICQSNLLSTSYAPNAMVCTRAHLSEPIYALPAMAVHEVSIRSLLSLAS